MGKLEHYDRMIVTNSETIFGVTSRIIVIDFRVQNYRLVWVSIFFDIFQAGTKWLGKLNICK